MSMASIIVSIISIVSLVGSLLRLLLIHGSAPLKRQDILGMPTMYEKTNCMHHEHIHKIRIISTELFNINGNEDRLFESRKKPVHRLCMFCKSDISYSGVFNTWLACPGFLAFLGVLNHVLITELCPSIEHRRSFMPTSTLLFDSVRCLFLIIPCI